MELIDKETAYKELSEYYHHTAFIQHLCLSEALDRVPVVYAIPVEWLEEKLTCHQELPYAITDGIANVLDLWKAEQEKQNDQTD